MNRNPKNSGFTLAELVVVMAVMPMLLVMIHTVLISTTDALKFVDDESASTQAMRSLRNVFMEDLSACYLPSPKGATSDKADAANRKLFLGVHNRNSERDFLSFITRRPSRSQAGQAVDINEVSYELRPNSRNYKYFELVRREEQLYDEKPCEGGKETVLYDRVMSCEISYFDGEKWLADWDTTAQNDLPAAVKIVLTISSGKPGKERICRVDVLVPLVASHKKFTSSDKFGSA